MSDSSVNVAEATADTVVTFAQLDLPEAIQQALRDRSYEQPTPIQAAIIPHVLSGRDVIGQAQTGTGKTAAFALPLLARVDVANKAPQVLVLAPTRELANQVATACEAYGAHMHGLRIAAVYGGAGYEQQLRDMRRGAQIIVGTPGRVMDHMERGSLKLDQLRCLVLDEADEMLRMGFIDDVEWVMERLPEQRQVALFSATMPREIRAIAQRYLNDPEQIQIQADTATATTVSHRYWFVQGMPKYEALARIIEAEDTDGVMVFARTKMATVEVCEGLLGHGIKAAALNGDLAQAARERCVEQLKDGQLDVVVATDVAARGLDVQRISHVINYDMPQDVETYVHRIGRTGRAGRSGQAILFVHPREKRMLFNIERRTKQRIEEMPLPDVEAINAARRQRFAKRIAELAARGQAENEALIAAICDEHELNPLQAAAALVQMVQGDKPLFLSKNAAPVRRQPKVPVLDVKPDEGVEYYKLQVGYSDGTKPGMIVGAIANELGIPGPAIGSIEIHTHYSTVALPAGLEPGLVERMGRIHVVGKPLMAEKLDGEPAPAPRRGKRKPAPHRGKGYSNRSRTDGYDNRGRSRFR